MYLKKKYELKIFFYFSLLTKMYLIFLLSHDYPKLPRNICVIKESPKGIILIVIANKNLYKTNV